MGPVLRPVEEQLVSDVDNETPAGESPDGVSPADPAEASSPEDGATGDAPEPTELERLQAERDKVKDQLLRTAADFDNFRKRARKDVEQAERRGREETLREILPVIDNLERAVQAAGEAQDIAAVRDGVQMVLKLFEDTAGRIGLERVASVGERFDPNLHDAFQQQETDEHPPGTVVAEYQPGYRLGERLLRPAMVVVSRKPPQPRESEGEGK